MPVDKSAFKVAAPPDQIVAEQLQQPSVLVS